MIKKVVVFVVLAAADCGVLLMSGKICNDKDIQMVVAVGDNAKAQCLLAQINRLSLFVVCCTELLLLSKLQCNGKAEEMTLLYCIFPLKVDNIILTEFRQPLQVQSHLVMPRILVQLGHTQCT